mmetsp:Transcript_16888/g.36566  ORF Transcript_16888/g.36566 Transcript_16888/m.36566 type:complete len:239 (+) Transcript_16888:9-725(+)|eukprot:CAMPEP_0172553672 /NCGR_PEP_ID=MMETSP1067-20121228/51340_1 /TAXON_ID=265564 ORGANISM="Thalassiosira punctigera, Strain Tpunct2005C2" /NCGR_SAMPLE_ID=MMETSP1067 /ASSEMBLY_ACC=CAM_ASM_000444 /LENGTH=238 /DNA_ID=CAMNT_0013341889 /DNA_START=9 /DNA_END=725 /DNA_ORIENTATION=+
MDYRPDSSSTSYSHPRSLSQDFAQLPPFLINGFDFLRHFVLFFLLPIAVVVFCALFAAALAPRIHRTLFARYATPEELLEDALSRLNDNHRKSGSLDYRSSSSASRKRALETLRLVIQLRPGMIRAYTLLATELFYGDITGESGESDKGHPRRRNISKNNTALRRRGVQTLEQPHDKTNNLSPALIECQELVIQGLSIDDKDESLLKLQNELQLINKYGTSGSHAKMMTVGHFGWMGR